MAHTTALATSAGEGAATNAAQPVERLTGLSYYSREQLESDDTPSRRDGVSALQEAQWRDEYTAIISEAGMRLRIPQWAIYTAAQLCHRFYAVRSMARNDRFLISAACLFLSAKLQEFPKRASDTALACDHVRFYAVYERQHAAWRARQQQQQRGQPSQPGQPPRPQPAAPPNDPEPIRWWEHRSHVHQRREELLVAERAVLFALNFALATAHPYASLLRWVAEVDWRHMARARLRQRRQEREQQEQGGQLALTEGGEAAAAAGGDNATAEAEEREERELAAALSRDVLHVAWSHVTDSARTQLGLMHHPAKLAAGALYLAAMQTGTLPLPPPVHRPEEDAALGAAPPANEAERRAEFFRRYRVTSAELDDIAGGMLGAQEELLVLTAGGGEEEEQEAAEGEGEGDAKRQRTIEGRPAPLLLGGGG